MAIKLNNDFELALDYGPYVHSYSRNGRHLLLGGKRGHAALFDWHQPKLQTERFFSDRIYDVWFAFFNNLYLFFQFFRFLIFFLPIYPLFFQYFDFYTLFIIFFI